MNTLAYIALSLIGVPVLIGALYGVYSMIKATTHDWNFYDTGEKVVILCGYSMLAGLLMLFVLLVWSL